MQRKELAKAYEERDELEYDQAIDHFGKAWEHAQHAIKTADRQQSASKLSSAATQSRPHFTAYDGMICHRAWVIRLVHPSCLCDIPNAARRLS
jgi:hypothetical protein